MPNFVLSKVELHPSGYCNLSCANCYGKNLSPEISERKGFPRGLMGKLFSNIRKKMPEENPLIVLSGLYSEPTINPDFNNALNQLGEHHFRFGIYTHGLHLCDELVESMVDSASKSESEKPSYVSINVSASLIVDRFRKELLPKIEMICTKRNQMLTYQEKKFEINAPIIVQHNFGYDLLFSVLNNLRELGVDNIRLSLPWEPHQLERKTGYSGISSGDFNKNLELIQRLEIDFPGLRTRLPENSISFEKCNVMAMSLAISPEGDVYPCPEKCSPEYRERFSYGNVNESELSEIWRNAKQRKLYDSLDPKKENCTCCPIHGEFNRFCVSLEK